MNMKGQVSVLAALAALTLWGSSPAAKAGTELVDILMVVEPIAILDVIDGSSSVVISDSDRAGWPWPPLSELAHIQLSTNFCITAVVLDFDRVSGIQGFPSHFYGEAIGLGTGNTLGVKPYAIAMGLQAHGGVGSLLYGADEPLPGGPDKPLTLSGPSNNFCPEPDGPGIFDIYLGVVSKWDLTLPPEPMFAVPDTYRISITATIIP